MKLRTVSRKPRGMALVVVLTIAVVMSLIVAAAITMAGQDEARAGGQARNGRIQGALEASVTYGRALLNSKYPNWSPYLSLVSPPSANDLSPTGAWGALGLSVPANLLPGGYSCYVYAKDNVDEWPNDPTRDNDQMIFVGSVCTEPSSGMTAELEAPLYWAWHQNYAGGTNSF